MNNFKKKILSGAIWSLGGRITYIFIGFISNIILARLITPDDFGRIGIAMTIITVANVISESGFSGALVRKLDVTKKDYSTAFLSNFILSLILFALLFLGSSIIANYFNDKQLENILRACSFIVIINTFSMVQTARANIQLDYKTIARITTISIGFSSIFAIFLAKTGYGVWSIVFMNLINSASIALLFWLKFGWITPKYFSKSSFKYLFNFGINTTLALFLNRFFDSIYQIIIGRFFSIQDVGYYYQAKKLQDVPMSFIRSLSSSVLYSSLSKLQEDIEEYSVVYSKFIITLATISGLISTTLIVYSYDIVYILFGEKWLGSVSFIEILTIATFFYTLETFNRITFKVFNQTNKILYLELIKKSFQTITIIFGIIEKNITILLIGYILSNIFGYLINLYYSKRIVHQLNWNEFLKIIRLIIISILVTVLFKMYLFKYIESSYIRILLYPFLLLIYFIGLKLIGIFNAIYALKYLYFFLKSK